MIRLGASASDWYDSLRKPAFQPPGSVFAPVWTVLYGSMAYAAYRLVGAPRSERKRAALILGGVHLALNLSWTPIFFQAKRPRLALASVVAQDITLLALLSRSRSIDRAATRALYPLAAWLALATALNFEIVRLNRAASGREPRSRAA